MKPRYFRRSREAREVTQWTGDNLDEISSMTNMTVSVISGWVYLRKVVSGALAHTIPPNGWVFYGEDDRLRVEDDFVFKSKYEAR
jgi:hypothetical protein